MPCVQKKPCDKITMVVVTEAIPLAKMFYQYQAQKVIEYPLLRELQLSVYNMYVNL